MTMASRLINNNVLLSWSKPGISNRRPKPKPLQFNVKLSSGSCSSRINNVAVSDGVAGENEAVNALERWKSKSASVLLGSCLLIVMMFITSRRPALASILKSLRIFKGCSFCSSGCLLCSEQMYNHFRIIFWTIFPVLVLALAFVVKSSLEIQISSSLTSIFTIQVGLLVGDHLLSDLTSISETLKQSGSNDLKALLNDMVEVLDCHTSNLLYGYSSGITVWEEGLDLFRSLVFQEMKRLDQKRPLNLRNSNVKTILQNEDELENRFVVVTMMMAYKGWHKLPSISQRRDLHRVLKKIASCNSKTKLRDFNILYVPKENDGSFTAGQVETNYPLLRPL